MTITIREFQRNLYKYLPITEDLVVTKRNKRIFKIHSFSEEEKNKSYEEELLHRELKPSEKDKLNKQPCRICGFDKLGWTHLHHIIPKSKGGTDYKSNLIALCPNCHYLVHAGKLDVVTDTNVVTKPIIETLRKQTDRIINEPLFKEKVNYCEACKKLGKTTEATGKYSVPTNEGGEKQAWLCERHANLALV